ncbi:Hypothetical protein DHA2_16192 [Giardia duodenalis]|uniref:Uncharacterized protein n=1 Tax=Giardia intestinalis TaxID=5741 RepID=V6TCX1_GIAIN|nr:Hypothetical protein DHA2_16192 [Giardia intestinalis]
MQLSAISSPNISRTRIDTSTAEMNDLQVVSQLAAVLPDEGSIMGPTLSRVPNATVPTYQVRTPLRMPPHSEMDVSVTLISDNASSCVCRTDVAGNIECFLRPLLEHLQGNAYVAKLFVRSLDLGEGCATVEISRMSPVAQIIIDIVVTNDINVSRLSTTEYKPGESMHVSLRDQPAPPLAYRPDFVPLHVLHPPEHGSVDDTRALDITRQEVAGFYDSTLRPDVCLTNSSDTQLLDRLESASASAYGNMSLHHPHVNEGNFRPPSGVDASNTVYTCQNHFPDRAILDQPIPPSANLVDVRPVSPILRGQHVESFTVSKKKYIRVLPSDCLFGPATTVHPQMRTIRIRNIYSSDIRVECAIASRSFASEKQSIYPELAVGSGAFEIVSQAEFRIPASADQTKNFREISIRFSPSHINTILHAAKVIINVAPDVHSDQHDNRAFQIPLLGIAGRPFLTLMGDDLSRPDALIKIGDQVSLRLKNDGLAPAFVKTAAIVQPKVPDASGYLSHTASEAYKTIPDSCIIAPGCSKDIFITRTGVSNKTSEEEEVIEIRYGHEGLRLLGMAYEGRGPWAELIKQLQLREDPLRIMGQNIEKLTIRLKV